MRYIYIHITIVFLFVIVSIHFCLYICRYIQIDICACVDVYMMRFEHMIDYKLNSKLVVLFVGIKTPSTWRSIVGPCGLYLGYLEG